MLALPGRVLGVPVQVGEGCDNMQAASWIAAGTAVIGFLI